MARVVSAVVALLLIPVASASAALTLSDPVPLPNSLPGDNQMAGGEPSLAFDPSGDGHLYSVAPGKRGSKGVNFWASADGGNTWQYVRPIGSAAGGSDSDVEVGIDHKVYVLDLEIASSAVCRSTNFGKSFEDGCETGQAEEQAGAEEDRQWLTHDPNDKDTTYFNYHDLSLQYPIIEKSTTGGTNYTPCGNLVDPSNPLFPSAIGNTVVGKTAAAKDGMLYVPITAPTPVQVASPGPSGLPDYGQIVIAHHKGCDGSQFDNTTVYSDDGASFTNIFVQNVVGPDGTVFVIASGRLKADGPFNTYLWVSHDQAKTFQGPLTVNGSDVKTNVFPAVAAGNKPGQVVAGWYGSQNVTDPNDTNATWRWYLARSGDYGKTWDRAVVTPQPFHYGDICTAGINCQTGGNRNLADFASVGVDPKTGCAVTIFPGDPFDTFDVEAADESEDAAAYISREACSSSAGGGTGSNGSVLGQKAGCHDTIAPVTSIAKGSRFSRRGVALKGTARDKGCGANGRGKVVRVSLAISRRVGKKCQWLQANGRFTKTQSCTKKSYVQAKGTSKWKFSLKRKLARGTYAVVPRAVDSVGNLEKPVRGSRKGRHNHNRYLFKVR